MIKTTGINQYADTPITDFYLGIANYPTVEQIMRNKTPVYIVVDPKFQYRPDLLSYHLYNNSSLWWIIVLLNRNQLQDPIRDLKAGMTLRTLSASDIKGIA
jgi:hypothetical protein